MDKPILKTYVYAENKIYYISTKYRQSSSMYQEMYYDTLVWELNNEGKMIDGSMVMEDGVGDIESAVYLHNKITKELLKIKRK